jgi:hypothetical protein
MIYIIHDLYICMYIYISYTIYISYDIYDICMYTPYLSIQSYNIAIRSPLRSQSLMDDLDLPPDRANLFEAQTWFGFVGKI